MKVALELELQRCIKCLKYKPISEFYYRDSKKKKLRSYCKECNKSDSQAYWQKLKKDVLTNYSCEPFPICNWCEETDLDRLCLDHVNGGGNAHRKSLKKSFYVYLRDNNYPTNPSLQVLCAECNNIKETIMNERKCKNKAPKTII